MMHSEKSLLNSDIRRMSVRHAQESIFLTQIWLQQSNYFMICSVLHILYDIIKNCRMLNAAIQFIYLDDGNIFILLFLVRTVYDS